MLFYFLCFFLYFADSWVLKQVKLNTRWGANFFWSAWRHDPDATTTWLGAVSHIQWIRLGVRWTLLVWPGECDQSSLVQVSISWKYFSLLACKEYLKPSNTHKNKSNAQTCLMKSDHMLVIPCLPAYNPEVRSSLFQAPGVTSHSLELSLAEWNYCADLQHVRDYFHSPSSARNT